MKQQWSILLVEDDAPVRVRLAGLIDGWPEGKLVAACGTLDEAIENICQHKVDILITDLCLPDGNGIEAIHTLRLKQPEAEIMVISVLGDHHTVIRAIEAGATGFLHKDANSLNLIAAIEELLAGGSPVSPSIARTIIRRISPASEAVQKGGNVEEQKQPKNLTQRETEILQGVVKGLTNADLARIYGISQNTVPVHIRNIYRKLETRSRSETIYEAMRLGLVKL